MDLRMELNIGDPIERIWVFDKLLRFAHLARDKNLVSKAMDMWRQFTEEIKNETHQIEFENFERDYMMWSVEFSSTNAPKKREIDCILGPASCRARPICSLISKYYPFAGPLISCS